MNEKTPNVSLTKKKTHETQEEQIIEIVDQNNWTKSSIKNHWFNLKEGEFFVAYVNGKYDSPITFTRNSGGKLIARFKNKEFVYAGFAKMFFNEERQFISSSHLTNTQGKAQSEQLADNIHNQRVSRSIHKTTPENKAVRTILCMAELLDELEKKVDEQDKAIRVLQDKYNDLLAQKKEVSGFSYNTHIQISFNNKPKPLKNSDGYPIPEIFVWKIQYVQQSNAFADTQIEPSGKNLATKKVNSCQPAKSNETLLNSSSNIYALLKTEKAELIKLLQEEFSSPNIENSTIRYSRHFKDILLTLYLKSMHWEELLNIIKKLPGISISKTSSLKVIIYGHASARYGGVKYLKEKLKEEGLLPYANKQEEDARKVNNVKSPPLNSYINEAAFKHPPGENNTTIIDKKRRAGDEKTVLEKAVSRAEKDREFMRSIIDATLDVSTEKLRKISENIQKIFKEPNKPEIIQDLKNYLEKKKNDPATQVLLKQYESASQEQKEAIFARLQKIHKRLFVDKYSKSIFGGRLQFVLARSTDPYNNILSIKLYHGHTQEQLDALKVIAASLQDEKISGLDAEQKEILLTFKKNFFKFIEQQNIKSVNLVVHQFRCPTTKKLYFGSCTLIKIK